MKIFLAYIKKYQNEFIFLFLFLFALAFCLYHLIDNPRTWFDEGLYIHIAKMLAFNGIYNFQIAPGEYADMSLISVGYPLFWPLAITFKIFGATMVTARLLMTSFILGFIGISYIFIKKLYGQFYAIISTSFLVTFSPLYGNGKNVLGEVPGLFFTILGGFFLLRAEETKWRTKDVILSMFFFGLAIASKPWFIPLIGGLCLFLLYLFLFRRGDLPSFKIFLIAFCTLSIPIFVWFFTQFNSQTSIIEILSHYNSPSGDPTTLHIIPNLKRFIIEITPIHFAVLFIIVVLGSFLRFKKLKITEVVLIFFIGFLFVSYIRTAGWYRYFFIPHILLLMFAPYAIHTIISKLRVPIRVQRAMLFLVFAVFLIFQSIRLYTNGNRMYYPAWRGARQLIEDESLKNKTILYFNIPEGAFFSKTENYYQTVRIRPGLLFGEENLIYMARYDMIVARDSDLETVRGIARGFKEYAHIGNYYFLVR